MKRLDFHIHFNSDDPALIETLAETCRKNSTIAALVGGLNYGEHDMVPNGEVMKFCKKYPDCFLPVAKLDMGEKTDVDQVYRFAEAGFVGLKCIYPWFEYDSDVYMPMYEAAEKVGLPVLFHTGNYRPSLKDTSIRRPILKNMNPLNLDRIARSFQKLKIVMAHLGTSIWRHEAAEYTKIHANLYADLAGQGAWEGVKPADFVELMRDETSLLDPTYKNYYKIVFGSDGYVTHPWVQTNAIRRYEDLLHFIQAPKELRKAIMGGTVASWMGVELEED